MPKFHNINFNTQAQVAAAANPLSLKAPLQLKAMLHRPRGPLAADIGVDSGVEDLGTARSSAWSAETAARSHLQTLLEFQGSERLAEITSPQRPELVPDLKLDSTEEQPLTGTHTITFHQTARSIPIFGTRATVEVDGATKKLVSVDGSLTDVPNLSPFPQLSPNDALNALAEYGKESASRFAPEEAVLLNYYLEQGNPEGVWRLVYVFLKVPMTPPEVRAAEASNAAPGVAHLYCCGSSFPAATPLYNYLVDANDGAVRYYYSAVAHLDVPVVCTGTDADGTTRTFNGLPVNAGRVDLVDPMRNIATYDHLLAEISITTNFPANPVTQPTANFGTTSAAAVSAHHYASLVFDFFNHVLKRHGVDGKGMKLESVVNCYTANSNPHPKPQWRNAAWWKNRMWYGQMPDASGTVQTTARFFDVIAHELTHGVTEHTAGLVYRDQSGALNESFSDIFGVLIKNWYPGQPNPIVGWNWGIGTDWNGAGTNLRSLQDPTQGQPIWPAGSGQPAHMNDYVVTTQDNGGVHINSGIHNRAAYLVLTARDAAGNHILTPSEVAILYYLTLTRLPALAKLTDCRRILLNVTTTYFNGNAALQKAKLDAITKAYDAVGIV